MKHVSKFSAGNGQRMIDISKPGWADQMGQIMGGQDEELRAEASGLTQRKCWRRDEGKAFASASKGGKKGAVAKSARRKLSLGHLE